jgi:hypothetical protein
MKPEAEDYLQQARLGLRRCASVISARAAVAGLHSPHNREMMIGFGTASDWVRWAVALRELTFASKREGLSARHEGITESVRFNLLWTATNALFARDTIISITASGLTVPDSELERFKLLYAFAGVDPKIEASCISTLNALLSMECKADGVISVLNPGGNPTMWEVIDQKYSRPIDRKRGLGKLIHTALLSKKLPQADGPTLIYGARNWAVHGMLLTSFFRGSRQKYITFVDNLVLLLSLVLRGAAGKFEKRI